MRLSPPRLWLLAFAGFFLMMGAWAVAAPYDGSPDEHDHVFRAVGVVSGEVAPPPEAAVRGSGAFQTVPNGLIRGAGCWAFNPAQNASCAVPPDADSTPVIVGSGAGRYHPAYYAIVGWPLKWWPGWPGVLLARLLSAAMSAAFLAAAFVGIIRRSRHRLMLAGLLTAATPIAMNLAGAINPNGPEIAAAIAFFTALILLVLGRHEERATGLIWLVGLSGVALAVLRTSGLLWVLAGFAACLIPWQAERIRTIWRHRLSRVWLACIALASVTAAIWMVRMKTTDLGDFFTFSRVFTVGQALLIEADRWRGYLDQMIGVTGWLDTRMSAVFYIVWELVAGALVIFAVAFGRWVDRWRMLVLLMGGVVIPSALQLLYANKTGFITQGRYLLPMLAGVLLFACFVLEERGVTVAQSRVLVRLAVVLLLPIQLACLIYTMVRWQNGLPGVGQLGIVSLNPLRGDWHPVLGSLLPLVAMVAGIVVVAVLAWRATSTLPPSSDETVTPEAGSPLESAPDGSPAGTDDSRGRAARRVGIG